MRAWFVLAPCLILASTATAQSIVGDAAPAVRPSAPPLLLGGVDCGSEELTQSNNPDLIGNASVWCGSLETSDDTSLARAFIAPYDLDLRCVTFGVRSNTGAPWPVRIRVLNGDVDEPYDTLAVLADVDVIVPAGASFQFFTVETPPVLLVQGQHFIVELNTPSRAFEDGGDGALLSLGCNAQGQSGPTYFRGPDCGVPDFVNVADVGFPSRHVVMTLGVEPSDGMVTLQNKIEFELPVMIASGSHDNDLDVPAVVFETIVEQPDRSWLRCYFSDANLPAGSAIQLTSLLDGEVQHLNANQLADWGGASGYFNGDAILVELIAGPNTEDVSFTIDAVGTQSFGVQNNCPVGPCGILGCLPRVQSSEDWSGRYFPAGCTASVISATGCVVGAGHCFTPVPGAALLFRVPNSAPDCTVMMPPIEDQFPVTKTVDANTGVGNDWRVMQLGYNTGAANHVPQTHYERYGVFKQASYVPSMISDIVTSYGYGSSNPPTLNSVQQQTIGMSVSGLTALPLNYAYTMSGGTITGGNSGGGLVSGDFLVGVVTHCAGGCNYFSTRVDHPNFKSAIQTICPSCISPPQNLKGWWPMDIVDNGPPFATPDMIGGATSQAKGLFGTGYAHVPGMIGRGVDFSAASWPLTVTPTGGAYDFGGGSGTIDAWIWLDPFNPGGYIVKGAGPAGYSFRALPSAGAYGLEFKATDPNSANTFTVMSTATFSAGTWTHVAVTVGAPVGPTFIRDVTFYINGGPSGFFQPTGVATIVDGGTMEIGSDGAKGLPGRLDEVQIFNRALTGLEIVDISGAGGKCKFTCGGQWDVPFCAGANSVASQVTICNKAPYKQEFHISFAPVPALEFAPDPNVVDGPTSIIVNHPNPFILNPGECRAIPITINRPAGMVNDKQVGVYEATIANLTGGQVAFCRGSGEDRRNWCAKVVSNGGDSMLLMAPGVDVDVELEFLNTSGAFINAPVRLEVVGPDMTPSNAFSINGLPLGEPFETVVAFAAGEVAPFNFSISAPEPVDGVSHVVILTDDANNGDFSPLIALTAVVQEPEACLADCNGDGVLNILDFVCFQQQWQQQAPAADCDGNGQYNILDFVCFQQQFQAGCL